MSDAPTTETRPTGRSRSTTAVDPKHIAWIEAFTEAGSKADAKAEKDRARGEAVSASTLHLRNGAEGLAGMKFDLVMKQDASLETRLLAMVGKQKKMTTLTGTGDAMAEFDTHHDLGSTEAVDPKTLQKAGESLRIVAEASQQLDAALTTLYADEFGIEPEELERMFALQQKRAALKLKGDAAAREKRQATEREQDEKDGHKGGLAVATPEELTEAEKADLEKFDQLRAKVEKEVRDEIWQPLVRQGLIPENFVPDVHSEVARTFEGASAAYQDRLEEYTAKAGENAAMVEKLGLAQKVLDQTAKVATAVLEAVPQAQGVAGFIKTGVECAQILADTGFQVAGQVLQKADAMTIAQTIANGLTKALAATDQVPPDILSAVDAGVAIALTGGRAIKGIMDGKPEDVIGAIGVGLQQSLKLAADLSGNPDVAIAGNVVAMAVLTGPKAKAFATALRAKPFDRRAMQQALADLTQTVLNDAAGAVAIAMDAAAERGDVSQDEADQVVDGTAFATDSLGALLVASVSDNKAAALSAALGKIANDACSAYLPSEYGSEVGAALDKALSKGPALITAVKARDPATALAALGSMMNAGLVAAAAGVGDKDPAVAAALTIAAATAKSATGTLKGAKAFEKAAAAGDVAGMKAAATKMVNAVMDPVLAAVDPDKLSDDGTFLSDDADEAPEGEEPTVDPESEAGQEMEAKFEEQRRAVIKKAEAFIKQGGDPKLIANAKKVRDEAVKELLERSAFMDEVAADARDFEAMLNSNLDPEETGEEATNEGDTRTLQALITTIQRDRKIMQMVDSLVGMGIEAAAAFFAPVGIAMDFKTFAVESAKAVAHLRQLLIWKQNAKEARNAVTVQVHTMLNRVGLEEDAVIEHQIKATLALISAIGNIIATVGAHAAPAGVAIAASAKVARAGLELALTIKSEVEMQAAWAIYQAALKNPKDRKNARKAFEKNATLAKYALVWGALNDENPIAQKALKRCGLTDNIIAEEKANVQGVVEYLEVLYNDDPIVLKAVPDTSEWGWKAPRPELTLKGWTNFMSIAQTKGVPPMKSGSGGAITAAFAPLEPARVALAKAKSNYERLAAFVAAQQASQTDDDVTTDPAERAKAAPAKDRRALVLAKKLEKAEAAVKAAEAGVEAALEGIAKAASSFKPLNKAGEPYARLGEWVLALAALAELEARELHGETVALMHETDAAA